MVEGHAGVISWAGRAGSASEALAIRFLHLGLRARPAGEISVAANRGEGGGNSSKVVFEVVAVSGAMRGGGVERRCSRIGTAMGGNNAVVVRGLPVDRGHALVEFLGMTELPLAEDGPKDGNTSDRRGNDNEYSADG